MKLPSGWIFIPKQTDRITIELEQIDLIQCKDCKYFSTDFDRNNRCDLYMDAYSPWAESQYSPSENGFCSRAERKEE